MTNNIERFTAGAREALSLAQEEALLLQHNTIESGHLLLGLMRQEDGIASRVLHDLRIDFDRAEGVVKAIAPDSIRSVTANPDLSPDTKRALELAVDEARRLSAVTGQTAIDTEHLLLALARMGYGSANEVLKQLSISPADIRHQTRRVIQKMRDEKAQPSISQASDNTTGEALKSFGIDPDEVRRQIRRMMLDMPQREAPEGRKTVLPRTQTPPGRPQSLVRKAELEAFDIVQAAIAGILKLIADGKLTSAQAAELFSAMQPHLTLSTGHTAQLIAKSLGNTDLEKRQLQVVIRDTATNETVLIGSMTLSDAMKNLDTVVDAIIRNDTNWFWADDVDTNKRVEFRIIEDKA